MQRAAAEHRAAAGAVHPIGAGVSRVSRLSRNRRPADQSVGAGSIGNRGPGQDRANRFHFSCRSSPTGRQRLRHRGIHRRHSFHLGRRVRGWRQRDNRREPARADQAQPHAQRFDCGDSRPGRTCDCGRPGQVRVVGRLRTGRRDRGLQPALGVARAKSGDALPPRGFFRHRSFSDRPRRAAGCEPRALRPDDGGRASRAAGGNGRRPTI